MLIFLLILADYEECLDLGSVLCSVGFVMAIHQACWED